MAKKSAGSRASPSTRHPSTPAAAAQQPRRPAPPLPLPGGPPCGRPAPAPQFRASHPKLAQPVLDRLRARLEAHLEREGLKRSEPRWRVAQLILESSRHLSAQDLVSAVRAQHPGIGAATVYRSLKTLLDAGIVRETALDPHGRAVYEPEDGEHHDHVVCADCGHIFEFHNTRIEAAQDRELQGMGFQEVGHRHVIYARCLQRRKAGA